MNLAINKLITIILILVVFIAIILLFSGTVFGISDDLQDEIKIKNCCNKYRANGCIGTDMCCEWEYFEDLDEQPICLYTMGEILAETDFIENDLNAICDC